MSIMYEYKHTYASNCKLCGLAIPGNTAHVRVRSSTYNSFGVCARCITELSNKVSIGMSSRTSPPDIVTVAEDTGSRSTLSTSKLKRFVTEICGAIYQRLGTDVTDVDVKIIPSTGTVHVSACVSDTSKLIGL